MRKISIWAKRHKWSARVMIIVSFIFLNFIGVAIGILFKEQELYIPAIVFVLSVSFYFLAFILYPQKQRRKKQVSTGFYIKQKSCDFILAASAFLMVMYAGNHPNILFFNNHFVNATVAGHTSLPEDSATKTYKSISSFSSSMKDKNGKILKWKERKKLLKTQIKGIKKENNLKDGEKTGLIILSIFVALGLIYLVASAACSLSCNGADGAALLVGIGGTALVIFLLVLVLRSISGKKKKRKQNMGKT